MAFTPKDAIDAARDIVTNAVERSADIVEDAGHIIRRYRRWYRRYRP